VNHVRPKSSSFIGWLPATSLSLFEVLAWVALVAAIAWAYHPALDSPPTPHGMGEVEDLLFRPASSSTPLLLGLGVLLLVMDRRRLSACLGAERKPVLGTIFILFAGALMVWAEFVRAHHLLVVSLSLYLVGGAAWLGGGPMLRRVILPAAILWLAIPIPPVLLNATVWPLQMATVDLTATMLSVLGIDHSISGDMIFTTQHAFQVIESCSGLRGIQTLLMASLVYVRLFERTGWRAVTIVLASIPIAFFFNGVRVTSIVLSPESFFGRDHTVQGLVTLVLSVFALDGFARLSDGVFPPGLSRSLRGAFAHSSPKRSTPLRTLSLLAVSIVVFGVGARWVDPWKLPRHISEWSLELPIDFQRYSARSVDLPRHFLGSVAFRRHLLRHYEKDSAVVEVLVGFDSRKLPGTNLRASKLALPGRGHRELERTRTPIGLAGEIRYVTRLVSLDSKGQKWISFSWTDGQGSFWEDAIYELLALDQSPMHRKGGVYVFRVSTPVDERATAHQRLEAFGNFLMRAQKQGVERREAGPRQRSGLGGWLAFDVPGG